jgi:predicted oxidoreductase
LRDQGFDEVFARAVLISTGGFTNDEEMVAKHMTRIPAGRYLHGGGPNACGDGHRLLQEVGATFVNMEHMWVYPIGTPNPRAQGHQRGLAVRGLVNEVWLNAQGRRFHNEDMRGGFSGTNALLSQPNQTCWSIFDAGELPKLRLLCDPYFDRIGSSTGEFLQSSEFVWQAETLADLTTRLPLPSNTAEREITRFNENVVNGVDPEFGRKLGRTRRLDQAPYYSIQYMPLVQKNLGGVKTDLSCRVIGAGGRPIAGLYAAGEVAGMAGGHINGERGLEGTMLGPSILAGRIAGRAIARSIRSGNRNGAV